jgi:bacillithiol biosynthesis cysteine-adding enzyme BshC
MFDKEEKTRRADAAQLMLARKHRSFNELAAAGKAVRLTVQQTLCDSNFPVPSDPGQHAVSATRIPVDVRRLPWIRKLAADYAFDFPALSRFFAGDPSQAQSWRDAIARAHACSRPRAEVADALRAQQERRNAPASARSAAELLRDPRAVAVVTGQQAGLFGGPLFTLLKALTALTLADMLRLQHQIPVVAVFWIDAEDQDWDEVSSCTVLDADLRARTLRLPAPHHAGEAPVASIRLGDEILNALNELEAALPKTEFLPSLLVSLGEAYRPGYGMAEAFGRFMEATLGRRGLVVYDSSDPASKPLVKRIFARELEDPDRTSELATQAGNELIALGYHAQVTPRDGPALFHLDGGRRAIRRQGNAFVLGDTVYEAAALASSVATEPEAFSPNVLLRPVVQDTLFPTVCYVAGPNELGYQAQLRRIYERFGVPMPLHYPRASATLLDSAAARFLVRYNMPLESLHPQDDSALNRLLESQLPPSVEQSLHEATRAVEERMAALASAVPALDPTLAGAVRSTLGKMQHDLKTLHSKIIQAAKRRDQTLRRQFERVRAQAFPGGHPQERVIGFVSFLARSGPELVDRLAQDLPPDLHHHWVVTL